MKRRIIERLLFEIDALADYLHFLFLFCAAAGSILAVVALIACILLRLL